MRLRRGIVALIVSGSALVPDATRVDAVASALSFPSVVTFPEVDLPVFETGPRRDIVVRNDTASSVKVGRPTIEGPNAALFSVVGDLPQGPQTVGPGLSATFTVEFYPYVGGTYHADLAFSTNGALHSIDLVGTARSDSVLPANLAGYRFVPMSPLRVLDSRAGLGWSGAVPAGGTRTLTLPAGTIDSSAGAVVLNVTATNTGGPGFVTVFPNGKAQPTASSLNVERAGQTIANLVTVALGGSSINFYSSGPVDLVADLAGYFMPSGATSAGRYQPVTPARLLDTRDPGAGGAFAAGEERSLAVAGRGGVPATGVSAVMLNVTSAGAAGAGFVTVWPSGIARPLASNVNTDSAGQTIPNQVVVSLPPSGALRLYSHQRSDLVVDVVGWYTDASATSDVVGLFFPIGPLRLLDTRDTGPTAGRDVVATVDTVTAGATADAVAVTANVTATGALAPGYVTAWSGAGAPPLASNLNVERPGQTVPNQVTSPLVNGRFSIFTQTGTDLVVDITGFYRGVAKTAFAAR